MAWPTIAGPDYGSSGEISRPQIRSEFEGGAVSSRPRSTRGRLRWKISWENLSEAHWVLLQAAFIADQGTLFPWVEPETGATYNVRYSEDTIQWTWNAYGVRQVSVGLETE
jgi:hypothetical protein